MDVVELMGVPVRALCLGQVAGGAVGVVAVCSHRTALPSTRFSLCEPTTQLEAHVRNVAQWAELRAERAHGASASGWAPQRVKPSDTVEEDLERGRFLSAEEAVAYGILDEVSRPDADIRTLPGARCREGPGNRRWGFARCADAPCLAGARSDRTASDCARGGHGAYDAAMAPPAAADVRLSRDRPDGPRLPPLAAGEWDEVLTRVLEGSPGGTTEPMNIFTTLGRADPELFRRWLGFGGALLSGTLPGRLRELVILRTAFRFGGAYEWAHHIELAEAAGDHTRRDRGAGPRRRTGRSQWAPVESAALRAVDETAADGSVSDATWEALEDGLRRASSSSSSC